MAQLAVEGRREHPGVRFYSFRQWDTELAKLISIYNAEKQEGRILAGRSPDEAFEAFWPHDCPPVQFDATCWHLCAHYVREFEVKSQCITFDIGKETFTYFDDALAPYAHRRVKAWFDPGNPGLLGVTDLNDRNPFYVKRSNPVDFLAGLDPDSPEAEAYRAELAKQAGFSRHGRAVFRCAKAVFNKTYRQPAMPRAIAALGQEMLDKRDEARKLGNQSTSVSAEVLSLCRQLNRDSRTLADIASPETLEVLRRQLERKRNADSEQAKIARLLIPEDDV